MSIINKKEELINCIVKNIIPNSINNYIQFFSNGKEPYYKMSNFNHIKDGIYFRGLKFNSTEHAFQAQKYILEDRIRFSVDGDLGGWDGFKLVNDKDVNFWKKKDNIGIVAKMATDKKRGIKLGLRRNKDFESTMDLWIEILLLKYKKPEYKKILLSTNNLYLLEFDRGAKNKSSKWAGIIQNGVLYGDNLMGIYHMIVRNIISKN